MAHLHSWWDQIQTLSLHDKKNVSSCAHKVAEECGELSSAVQALDGLDGAHDKIASRHHVLEECVDGILANLSIVCKMGFDPSDFDDMMSQKIAKWATKQRSQAVMHNEIPYEIHITVTNPDITNFKHACAVLGVKPIVLDLQTENKDIQDVMTSSVVMGNNQSAINEMERVRDGLIAAGFHVVRSKIETVPWHPAAPSHEYLQYEMPKDCYFESHIAVLIPDKETQLKISALCVERHLHLSKNAMKRYEDGSYRQMITYRAYSGTREQFHTILETHVSALRQIQTSNGDPLYLDKVITEFSLYDSKVHHDQVWINK